MPNRYSVSLIGAALAMVAVPAVVAAQSTSGQDLTPEGPGAYIAIVGATDLFTIRSAEIALEKATQPHVRNLARHLLTEHQSAVARLGDAAQAVGLEELLPPGMLPMHWDMLRDLEDASRSRFDEVYLDRQVAAHEVAVELHRNFAANGRNALLKEYAQASLPMATSHLDEVRRLEQ